MEKAKANMLADLDLGLKLFLEVTQDKAETIARIGCGSFYAIKGAGFESSYTVG